MSELDRQLAGVKVPKSPPAESQETDDLSAAELEALGDEAEGIEETSDEKGSKPDRPVLNLKKEFDRKMGNLQDEIIGLRSQLASKIPPVALATEQVPGTAEPSLDNMSVDQLRQLRGKVPPESAAQLEDLITERVVANATQRSQSQYTEEQRVEQLRMYANQTAANRYPELMDSASEYRKAVLAELDVRGGDSYINGNARAVLDVANHVAMERGMRAQSQGSRTQGNTATGANSEPPAKKVVKSKLDPAITEKLAEGMLDGKFDEKALVERAADYGRSIDLYKKGGTR